MDLFSRFKKDYLNYLLSIILPGIVTAGSIPLFKLLLGAKGYGNFSITFNSVLLCSATLSGWISQSILRYFPASTHKRSFARQSILLSGITQAIFSLPVFCIVWYLKGDLLMALFFTIALFITSLQFSILAIGQSIFLSKKSIYSEILRTGSYITIALILLKFTGIHYMYALFTAIIFSYFLSFGYLYSLTSKELAKGPYLVKEYKTERLKELFIRFILYGGPLSLFFIFAYLISLVDKFFMLNKVGAEVEGNYQAMFDFLSKSITIVISPVVISLLPLLTMAYQHGRTREIKKLLVTLFGVELAALFVTCILYWWFGSRILFGLIKIPDTPEYKLMGLILIAGTFIWQMAIIVHKRYELKFKSTFLLGMVAIAFMSQLLLYIFFDKSNNLLLYPLGYALSSVVYLFLVSIGLIGIFLKRLLH